MSCRCAEIELYQSTIWPLNISNGLSNVKNSWIIMVWTHVWAHVSNVWAYCTGQRSPHKIFFNRLPGPPRRLDLTQMVLMTTESASSESGGRQAGAGGSAKTRACIRGIPRSARGRGRVARPDATPTGCRARARDRKIYPVSLSKFRKQSTRKSEKCIRCRIQFWAECICQNFDSGHAARTQNIF